MGKEELRFVTSDYLLGHILKPDGCDVYESDEKIKRFSVFPNTRIAALDGRTLSAEELFLFGGLRSAEIGVLPPAEVLYLFINQYTESGEFNVPREYLEEVVKDLPGRGKLVITGDLSSYPDFNDLVDLLGGRTEREVIEMSKEDVLRKDLVNFFLSQEEYRLRPRYSNSLSIGPTGQVVREPYDLGQDYRTLGWIVNSNRAP